MKKSLCFILLLSILLYLNFVYRHFLEDEVCWKATNWGERSSNNHGLKFSLKFFMEVKTIFISCECWIMHINKCYSQYLHFFIWMFFINYQSYLQEHAEDVAPSGSSLADLWYSRCRLDLEIRGNSYWEDK